MKDLGIVIPLWLEAIFFAIYVVVFCLFVKAYNSRRIFVLDKKYTIIFLVFFMIFAVYYCLDGDYYRYKIHVEKASDIYRPDTIEYVYQRLAFYINGNYNLFRLIVWGGAIILMSISTKLMRVNVLFMLMSIFVIYYEKVVYARATMGMSIYFLGLCLLLYCLDRKKIVFVVAAIAIIIISIFFHRSMIFLIALTPTLVVPLENKKMRALMVVFLAFIALALTQIDFLSELMHNDEEYDTKYDKYNSHILGGRWAIDSIKSLVSNLFSYTLFYLPFFYISSSITKYGSQIPLLIRRLYRINFSVIAISTSFFILYGGINVFFYRTLYMCMIPICILLSYCSKVRIISRKKMQSILIIAFVYMLLHFMTSIYNS